VKLPVPTTFMPVPVTTTTLALPTALKLILPFADGILTFEFPFANTPTKLPDVVLPDTVKLVSVPVLVILGCAAVITVPAVVALPDKAPTNVVAVIDALPKLALILVLITADEFPFADEAENVGYTVVAVDVFCNNADALVAEVALPTVPITLAPTNELNPLPLPVNTPVFAVNATAVTVPFTPKVVNVPTLVILGCAAVVTVPAVVARGTVPVTLAPAKEVKLAPDPTNKLAEITLAPVRFPPEPDVDILPKLALPVVFNVPATLTPVPVTTIIFALPAALILTLPFADGILTLLLPLTMAVALPTPVSR